MKKIKVTITSVSSDHSAALFLPKSVCKELEIEAGAHVIQCGGLSQSVRVMYPMYDKASICSFSPDVIQSLALMEGSKLYLYKKGEKLQIGPVIGIFAKVNYQNGEIQGMQAPIFEQLLSIAEEEHMYAYVMAPQDVSSDLLRGYVLQKTNGTKRWEYREVPFPDVVYDQIISRKFESRPNVKSSKQELIKKLGAAYFNPGFFDKAQVHKWLASEEETKGFLPATIEHQDAKRTAAFIEQYKQIYLKPINGSLGVGIIRLIRLHDGSFLYQVKGKKGIHVQGTQKRALDVIRKFERRLRKRPYVVQEGLQLKTYQGRPFDIRVLVQKDHTGKWKRTKMFCRIAQAGDITSNLSTGGDALPVSKMLQEINLHKDEIKKIQKNIKKLVNMVPAVLEKASGIQLGEIGLDIGIDARGWVWVIEVNSKPWKKPFTEQGSMDLVVQSFRRPLLYGKYLAGIT
ncbi:YheC/YheD family protein [Effusibacillus consociatus]|uniref:YheC/YheD family protein n=1 Tax=Effusibacillus consociatus TaxID=1117041 RepID=A0ABV9PVW8_9BACL